MDAHLPDAESMVAAGDHKADLTAGVEPGRSSPASAVCYLNTDEAQETPAHNDAPSDTIKSEPPPAQRHDVGFAGFGARGGDESDSTPRSEVPSALDLVPGDAQPLDGSQLEPGYFSPQPLRLYGSMSASAPASTDPSPIASVNASTTSVNAPEPPSTGDIVKASIAVGPLNRRPSVQRDDSSASTASTSTIRPHSVDPYPASTPHVKRQRDGPYYPDQSYAALHFQPYPIQHYAPAERTRSSHHAHFNSLSAAHVTTFGLPPEHHRDIMESGSRTVGNSPASSPGLFSPITPPLRHMQQPDDGRYSSPWLHHTQRQAPRETHVADVDVDPISGRKIVNQYEILDELGRGVHGKVKLGRNLESGANVAIKIVDRYSKRRRLGKNTSHEDKIKREIAILKKARHPNIVSLLEVIDDPTRKKVYIVLEHVRLGEVRWRAEGEKEVCLIEWRRYQRESKGIFENDSAAMEDEKIIALAHQKLERQQRQRARLMHTRRLQATSNEAWSLEHGGDSEEEISENGRASRVSRVSTQGGERTPGRHQAAERWVDNSHHESNMETAVRATTPTSTARPEDANTSTGLEGTMYGPYDTELIRGRTPSVVGSSSSHFTDDDDDEVPEHFRYVPFLTLQAARETFRDTVLGLEYLHFQKVVHRDIKPANLLQTSEHRIKISDFGVSYLGRQPSEDSNGDQSESDLQDVDAAIELAKTVGTPAFYAPELCTTDPDGEIMPVDEKIDIWALGVTLYCLIYGRVPFFDHNTFHLMKMIAEDDVYIPQFRLKAIAGQSGSRPNSHGRMYHPMTSSKRAPHDLEYEEVDDILRDLLKRLLTKDPRKRITIMEIKRHPWLLQGLDNFGSWVEDTDPGRPSQGRKIEVSKEDMDKAVVPLTLIDRVRSGVRKTLDTVLGMGRRGGSRRRAQSTATDQPQSTSANSSSSPVSQEGRRPSLAINQSIFEALSRSREPEHPLSQSVTASPEAVERAKYFEGPNSRTASPAHSVESYEHPPPLAPVSVTPRPLLSERAHSAMSSAASIRTVRQSDLSRRPISPNIPPALPGTPTVLDTPGGSNLGGIFGGVPRRFVNSVRSRERMLKPPEHMRAKSIDRLVGTDDDAHGEPSIALSTALAAGHVDQPDVLKDLSPTSARGPSPIISDLRSPDPTERASSRQSSISSASSYRNRMYAAQNPLQFGPPQATALYGHPAHYRETSDERYNRAKDEFVRQRVAEENQSRERPLSLNLPRPTSALSQSECPPSPDDEVFFHRQKVEDYLTRGNLVSTDTGPVAYPFPSAGLVSSSSEDRFTSMSQSTSNPSIPSVVSANSSVAPDECLQMNQFPGVAAAPSGDSINQFDSPSDDPAGYDGDHPLESDDDDSDEEGFLMMGKSKPQASGRSGSISNAELARSNIWKESLSQRRRSARSGSNGTVKKIQPQEDADHDRP